MTLTIYIGSTHHIKLIVSITVKQQLIKGIARSDFTKDSQSMLKDVAGTSI